MRLLQGLALVARHELLEIGAQPLQLRLGLQELRASSVGSALTDGRRRDESRDEEASLIQDRGARGVVGRVAE